MNFMGELLMREIKLVTNCDEDPNKSFFQTKPDNLLSWHEIYKDFFNEY